MLFSSGIACASAACNADVSIATTISTTLQAPLRPWMIIFVTPTSTPSRYSVSGATSSACSTLGLPMLRWCTGSGKRIRFDLPIISVILPGRAASPLQRGPLSARSAGAAGAAAFAAAAGVVAAASSAASAPCASASSMQTTSAAPLACQMHRFMIIPSNPAGIRSTLASSAGH
jgi:hypothetical protein